MLTPESDRRGIRIIKNRIEGEHSSWLGNDLSFLESFRKNCHHFQEQIQAYLGYLVPGSSLLDQAIASIRGIVEIDQAERDHQQQEIDQERDRNLQITILAVGTGIGAGGILAFSYALVTTEDPLLPPFSSPIPHRFTISICYSLLFGVAVGLLIWGVPRISQFLSWVMTRISDHTPDQ